MAVFIDHVHELERAAIHRLVELKVDRPDVIWILRAQQLPAATGRPRALAPARQGPLQTFLTPDPLHSFVINAPAIKAQPPIDQPPAPAPMAKGKLQHLHGTAKTNHQGLAKGGQESLNKIPDWHQIAVKSERANDMKEGGNKRGK